MKNLQKTLAISVRGASHFDTGKPCQDSSLAVKNEEISIAVVCDGHGGDSYFRSEIGSKFATEVIRDRLVEFYERNSSWEKACENFNAKSDKLKAAILTDWQQALEAYTKENPFTEEEMKKVSASFLARKDYDVGRAYGSTALAAMVCKEYYLLMMIGDGAIVKINEDFSSSVVTFEGKKVFDDQPHSLTDSLCEQDAYYKIFFRCQPIKEGEKLAFGLCSDGMSEAFISDEDMLNKFENYLNYYAEEGLENSIAPIEAQLNLLSKRSSMKDDVSLAFATLRLEAFDKRGEEPVAEEKKEEEAAEEKAEEKKVEAADEKKQEEAKEASVDEEKAPEEQKEDPVAEEKLPVEKAEEAPQDGTK